MPELTEILFYKNNGRYTVTMPDYYFVQVIKRKNVRTLNLGRNMLICEDAAKHDVAITETEFFYAFEDHCNETKKFIKMISEIKNKL